MVIMEPEFNLTLISGAFNAIVFLSVLIGTIVMIRDTGINKKEIALPFITFNKK